MDIISQDFKKGKVVLRVTSPEDIWYASHLIEPEDLVEGKTTRKIKIGSDESAAVAKKTFILTVRAEKVELDETGTTLRVNGTVQEGREEVPKDSYHTITLEKNSEFTLEKPQWRQYQKQKLQEATEKQFHCLILLLDREEALYALAKPRGAEVLAQIEGNVPKKGNPVTVKNDFYMEIIETLEKYNDRYSPDAIVVASPAFYKDELLKKISSPALKKKITLATCSDVGKAAVDEVIKRPELARALATLRLRKETVLVDQLLKEIRQDGKAVYGWKEVEQAARDNAVQTLIVTHSFLHAKHLSQTYQELDAVMNVVDEQQGDIMILSPEQSPGKTVDGLGGIAALLRYRKNWSER